MVRLLTTLVRVVDAVTGTLGRAVAWLTLAMMGITCLVVMLRYGFGVGSIAPAWGLYLFTGCVLVSLAISLITKPTE